MPETATLLVSCPYQNGLVSVISSFIFRHGGNILQSDQYTDIEAGVFLARFEFHRDGFRVPRDQIAAQFRPLAQQFGMKFELHFSDHVPKVALFASRLPHCRRLRWSSAIIPPSAPSPAATACPSCIFPSPRKTRNSRKRPRCSNWNQDGL